MTNDEKIPVFWYGWLVIVSSFAMILAASMVFNPGLIIDVLNFLVFNKSQNDTGEGSIRSAQVFLGVIMLGWSILLLLIVLGPFRQGHVDGWNYLLLAVVAWFVPDTIFSVVKGYWHNALIYFLLTLALILPLAGTYNAFRSGKR